MAVGFVAGGPERLFEQFMDFGDPRGEFRVYCGLLTGVLVLPLH